VKHDGGNQEQDQVELVSSNSAFSSNYYPQASWMNEDSQRKHVVAKQPVMLYTTW